ncbi:MAG: anti-sigma factor [Candidatus Cybelea sp.]
MHGGTGTTRPLEGPRTIRGKIAAVKQSVWPAYLVAAACFAIALISSIANISLLDHLKQQEREVAHLSARATALARSLTSERIALLDISDSRARHYDGANGEVIARGSHIYLAVHALPEPPRGKVYECWTVAKGATRVSASPTFLPDARGAAIVLLPVDARSTTEVTVTLEPDGGSREPTGKPLMDVSLGPR